MLTKKEISSMTRAQVWQHINSNQLGIKKNMATADARKSLVDYYYLNSKVTTKRSSKSAPQSSVQQVIEFDLTDVQIMSPQSSLDPHGSAPKTSKKSKSIESKTSISAQALQSLISVSKIAKTSKLLLRQDNGQLTATAIGVGMMATNYIDISGDLRTWEAIADKTLISYVKGLKDGEFVSIDGNHTNTLRINSKRGSLELDTDSCDFPEKLEFDRIAVTNSFTCGAEFFISSIKKLSPCRSVDVSALSGIIIKIDGVSATLAATDGSRLSVANVDLLYDKTPPDPSTINLPANMVYGLLNINPASICGAKITIDVTKSHIKVTFSNSNVVCICVNQTADFTSIASVIEQVDTSPSNRLTFDSGLVRDRLQLLAPIATLSNQATVTLTLDRTGHAHITAADVSHIADTSFQYGGVPIDRKFEFDYGFFIQGIGTDNELIELSCPSVDDVPFVKLSTANSKYYLAQVG